MTASEKQESKSSRIALWAAGITAAGAIGAALVGVLKGSESNPSAQTVQTTAIVSASSGGVAAGRDINAPVYNAPVYQTYNKFSNPFKGKNGLLFSPQISAIYLPNQPSSHVMGMAILNVSTRRIGRAQVLVYDALNSEKPYAVSDEKSVGQRETLLARNELPIDAPPPESINVCLTYESDEPGKFVTLLVTMNRGEGYNPNVYSYSAASDYRIFYSAAHADCKQKSVLNVISTGEYFGRG
ncbi:hypothetical protein RI103_24725 [Paraburkholderia sp. FT54]|uniref:hypothetical protein n=1 Tax=Paraburkholderia sp. FT54 TaxID=3074437 RepID=UPI002877BB62|nr:hypothetical protein [Paraburkholderia sp. FT54]WNC93986.1 hypothetical protein RI103_24725 [Paraburkholderia sp. FT54]